jgi:hypothetical protein
VPPAQACAQTGPPYPEVTGVICRVPSTPFSQAPRYSLPVHLCRFRVRSISVALFPGRPRPPSQSDKREQLSASVTSTRLGTINPIPIDYGCRPRLRDRLTLRGLTLRRNPWTSGERVSHPLYRYSCQHSRFRCLQHTSRCTFTGLRNAPLPLHDPVRIVQPAASVRGLSPVTFSAQDDLFRPVSYYAFFKGWLLLSQPPGCLGLPTSFPT